MPIFVASSLATALHNHCTLTTYDLKFSPNTMLTNTAVFVYSLLPLKYSPSTIKFFFSISAQPSMQGRSYGSKCKEGVVVIKAKCFFPPRNLTVKAENLFSVTDLEIRDSEAYSLTYAVIQSHSLMLCHESSSVFP